MGCGASQEEQHSQQGSSTPARSNHAAPSDRKRVAVQVPTTPEEQGNESPPSVDSSPTNPFKSVGPFATFKYDVESEQPSSSEGSLNVPANRTRTRSVMRLEQISEERQKGQPVTFIEDVPSEMSSASHDGQEKRMSISMRGRRRVSSIFGELADHVETFLSKGRKDTGDEREQRHSAEEDLRKVFGTLDADSDGLLTKHDLKDGFEKMGHTQQSAQLDIIFRLADKDKDGCLDWTEFSSFFKHITTADIQTMEEEEDLMATSAMQVTFRRKRSESVCMKQPLRGWRVTCIASLRGRVKALGTSMARPLFAACHREDRVAHLYSLNTLQEVRSCAGHRDSMLSIAFSPDNKTMATCSRDCSLMLWDTTVGHVLGILQHPGVVTCCGFSSDGKYIYTGCQDNRIRKYTAHKPRFIRMMERLPDTELGVIVSLGCQNQNLDTLVMSRSCDHCAYTVSTAFLTVQKTLDGHQSMVWQSSFSQDDTLIITNCEKVIKVWDTRSGSCLISINSTVSQEYAWLNNGRPKLWTSAQFCPSPYGELIVAFNTDTSVFFFHIANAKPHLHFSMKSAVYCAAVGTFAPYILCGDDLGNVFKIEMY